jgi:uncharacterized protein (TIGR02145 family)
MIFFKKSINFLILLVFFLNFPTNMITKFIKFALTAGIVLALASTLSCGNHSWEDIFNIISDSCGDGGNFDYGSVTDKDGNTYRTVKIGNQRWMAENLATNVDGSVCYGNDPANCSKYGRLYGWAMAMGFPYECNRDADEKVGCIAKSLPHQGICPAGWHIPSNEDWYALMKFVDPSCSDNSKCANAGAKLKATCGWEDTKRNKSGNGTDDYGFAALPSGTLTFIEKTFVDAGVSGLYWKTTPFAWNVVYDSDAALLSDCECGFGGWFGAVRCVEDTQNGGSI